MKTYIQCLGGGGEGKKPVVKWLALLVCIWEVLISNTAKHVYISRMNKFLKILILMSVSDVQKWLKYILFEGLTSGM
jgi:hypothetical protein